MNPKITNTVMVVAAVTLLSLLSFYVRIGVTADSIVVLKTSGMNCGSCSSKITDSLQDVKGVAVTEVDVEGGWVVVGYDTKMVAPETLVVKVDGAGFASTVYQILSPEQFRQITGRDIGKKTATNSGCCGKSGCGSGKQS
jgi:copper chaperone CopZ